MADEEKIRENTPEHVGGKEPNQHDPEKTGGLEEKMGFATIKGKVMGHDGTNYTNGIGGGHVYLVVYWKDQKGKSHTAEINEKEIEKLRKERPDIYDVVITYKDHFASQITNDHGEFEFKDVPIYDWYYIVKAYVGKKNIESDHTKEMGNDGKGGNKVIPGAELLHEKVRDGVVVPVKDIWEKEYEPEPRKDPKHTKFVPGFE